MLDVPENLIEITTKLPSFLEVLFQEKCNIKLVYSQRDEINGKPHIKQEIEISDVTESELDLTGTPLMTDLGGSDSICDEVIPMIPPSWSPEEAKYHPLSVKKARTYLNQKLSNLSEMTRPIYCLCDGSDAQNTLALGMTIDDDKLMRTVVYVLPCCYENHEVTTLHHMKKDHVNNVRRNAEKIKTEILITKCYYLWGYNLKNCSSLQNAEHNGFVAVETASVEVDGKTSQASKMILQVITGHSNSLLNSFWKEMVLIQFYINLLVTGGKLSESYIISENSHLDCEEITSLISDLLISNVNCFKKKASDNLDLENLRQENVLEKLWHILKYCRTLSDLRDCLHFFFEELLEVQTRLQIFNDDMSKIAEIVNGLVDGKKAVPSLGFTQCLELMVDLGLEKLKNDYLFIINNFYTFAKEPVMKRWRDLCGENVPTTTTSSLKRKSRISINPMSPMIDLSKNRLKLLYVDCMHKVAELMFLYKDNVKFSEDAFDHFCEAVCSNFITTDKNLGPPCDVSKPRLHEFSFNLLPSDDGFVNEISPATWLVKMTSTIESSEVTTVFHFSEFPIFPPSLFDNYDVSFNNSNVKSWYVAKLVKYFGNR